MSFPMDSMSLLNSVTRFTILLLTLYAFPLKGYSEEDPAGNTSKGDVKKVHDRAVELKGLDDKPLRPFQVKKDKANVVIFTNIDCPVANYYIPGIKRLSAEYGPKGFHFLMVHCDPYLEKEAASNHKKEFQYDLPVVLDKSHDLVRAAGIKMTPEVVVVMPSGEIAYRGSIDDLFAELGKKRRAPRNLFLRMALDDILAERPVGVQRTKSVGCIIEVLPKK